MRFGISATSSIFPKDLRTRLRPVNVCAIVASFFLRPPRMGSGVFRPEADRKNDQGGGMCSAIFMPSPHLGTPVRNERRHGEKRFATGNPNADPNAVPNTVGGACDERRP